MDVKEVAGKLLKPSEAARYLGVSRSMIYKLVSEEELTVVRVGADPRFERQSLDDYIERRRRPAVWARSA